MTRREIEDAIAAERARIARSEARLVALSDLLRLHSDEDASNIGSKMQANVEGKSRRVKISAARTRTASASRRAFVSAGVTDQDVAEFTGAGRSTVQAWHSGRCEIEAATAARIHRKWPQIDPSVWPKTK